MSIKRMLGMVLLVTAMTGSAHAQTAGKKWSVEALAGAAVPTFDITDLADPGFVGGIAGGYVFSDRVVGMVELDFGKHDGPNQGPSVNVYHYMAKAGYRVFQSESEKWRIYVNAGLGAMTFDVDVPAADPTTYFAINAGAKIYYGFSETISLVISPQGDIAFVDENDGFTGSTAWVWPITAGIAFAF